MRHIRNIRVVFEHRQRNAKGYWYKPQYDFFADGSRHSFSISFEAHKSLAGSLDNNCQLTIMNMRPESYAELYSHYSKYRVTLEVGYEGEKLGQLFQGMIMRIWNAREGLDDKVTVSLYQYVDRVVNEGGTAYDTGLMSVNWMRSGWAQGPGGTGYAIPGTKLRQFLFDFASEYSKQHGGMLTVKLENIDVEEPEPIGKDRTFSGSFPYIMDTLGQEYNFTWTIQNNVFQVVRDSIAGGGGPSGRKSFRIGPKNLMKCEPVLQGQFGMNQVGISVDAVLDPAAIPGSTMEIESKIYPQANGKYIIHEADYSGSSYQSDWKMTLTGKNKLS